MPSIRKKVLPDYLTKGGHIPMSISPMYYYNTTSHLKPFQTLQKQPRTLQYSMDFDFRYQLESEYPDLKLSVLESHQSSNIAINLKFPNQSDTLHECDDHFNTINDILTPKHLYQTTKQFTPRRWEFGGHAFEPDEIPGAADMTLSDTFNEVCLCGQSNTGKSSLVNCLMGSYDFHKGMAVVSKKAGRTRMLNFYTIPFHFSLVDMMGYGFALKVDKKIRDYWLQFMKKYLTQRLEQHLKHVFVLIDTDFFIKRFKKHPDDNSILSPNDEQMLTFLDDCYVPYSLVLTKVDCINDQNYEMHESGTRLYTKNANDSSQFEKILSDLKPIFDKYYMIRPFVNVTSARLGFGVPELQCTMAHLCQLFEKDNTKFVNIDIAEMINKC
eukprot:40388_1